MSGEAHTGRSRWIGVALLALGLVALLVVGLVRGRARNAERAAFPQVEGLLRVRGLDASVEILRDAHGVSHVEAQRALDAFFGLGFAHAQDRLGQMQWLVRLARGRSAAVEGAAGLPADRLARILDLGRIADGEFERLDGSSRRVLEAYARGVNARIARIRAGAVAPPLRMDRAGMPVEDWLPADSLAVLKFYAWSLSASVDASLVLDDLLGRLGGVGARRFFPGPSSEDGLPAPGRAPVTARRWRDPLRRAAGLEGCCAGSSAWVLGGAHTASGRPLLVADSHLEPTVPPLLYVAHLRGGDLDVAGATLPGVPGFWTGHNRNVAWASTHARAAVTDLYTEMLHPDGEPLYHDGRGWRDLAERVETIEVRDAEDEILTVRSTSHGPLLDGVLEGSRDPLAIAWVGLRGEGGGTLAALLALARTRDAAALIDALAHVTEPALAVVYADAEGAAGMQVAGWIPWRPLATELVPVPGRARWYDWDGRIPFESLPRLRLADGRGWAMAADNDLSRPGGRDRGEWLWRSGARARQIDARLHAAVLEGPVELDGLARLQSDVRERRGQALLDAALQLVGNGEALGREAGEVVRLLQAWNGEATPESVGAGAYHVFLVVLTDELLAGRLGEELLQRYLELSQVDPEQVVYEIVREAAAGGEPDGWADSELVAAAVRASLREAWFRLSSQLGANRGKWRWGRLHRLVFRPFGPASKAAPAGLGPFEAGGSASTVNAAEYAPAAPYEVRLASIYRFAVDAASLDRSLSALAPGQSEHPGHPHYADALRPWLEGRFHVLSSARPLVEEELSARLVLEPVP
ncbi:MAG: penicillin acylase family protein [Deltaproteobacteria bacterium]|nr:penicillin acylase family protein [Deltaproteobacteria bacterium]